MFWAAFKHNIWTGLIPLDGDPDSACGGVSSQVIYNLYYAFLPGLL
jgi:hypothetical protein